VDLHPWDAEARLQKGLLAERAGELRAAADHLREAASRAPDDWRIWVALSRVALKGGNVTLAFKALTKARELNPRNPVLFSGA
jgi:Flp pilus assembly protein TadD